MASQLITPEVNHAAVESAMRNSLTSSIENEIEQFLQNAGFHELMIMDALLTLSVCEGIDLETGILTLIRPKNIEDEDEPVQ